MKKYSFLGLLLATASVVTVAMVPSKSKKAGSPDGKIRVNDDDANLLSCTVAATNPTCNVTLLNETSSTGANEATGNHGTTTTHADTTWTARPI